MKDPTPTVEEFVYSFHPTQWFEPTLENLLYWDIKTAVAMAPTAVRVAWLMRTGMTLSQAGYIATDNITFYRIFQKASRLKHVPALVRHAPMLAAPAAGVAFAHATVSDPVFQQTGKPFWMPLPIWVALARR